LIPPAQLMSKVTAQSRRFDGSTSGTAYTAGGDLGELGRIGQQFMKTPPNSGTADRGLVNLLMAGGATAGFLTAPLSTLGGLAGTLATNAIAGRIARSGALSTRLINNNLLPAGNKLSLGYAKAIAPGLINSGNPNQ
jgi:hypothetical protein